MAIAVLGDGYALDILHYKVRPALGRGARVEDSRDIRVVHHGQRLTLIGEAGEYLASVHAEFYYFEGHKATNGLKLLSQIHSAHAPFAQRSKDLIAPEVVIPDWRYGGVHRLNLELECADGSVEDSLDQTPRA